MGHIVCTHRQACCAMDMQPYLQCAQHCHAQMHCLATDLAHQTLFRQLYFITCPFRQEEATGCVTLLVSSQSWHKFLLSMVSTQTNDNLGAV